jgi:glyoxylase-like metal-dependent hydrolase (beta-lactamase superfamily II)
MSTEHDVTVHRFEASLFPVNAYLVETGTGIVVVDATLSVSDGRALRARVDALKKPLAAVVITHSHPDHYGGVTSLLGGTNVPIYAIAGVDEVIRRDTIDLGDISTARATEGHMPLWMWKQLGTLTFNVNVVR